MPPKHSSLPLYIPDWTIVMLCSLVYRNTFWIGFKESKMQLQDSQSKLPNQTIITPILHSLHWLPVAARIQYEVSSLCHSSLSDSGPDYLSRVLRIYTPSRQLRSSSDNRILCFSSVKTKTFGQRSCVLEQISIWHQEFTVKNLFQASPQNPSV